MGPGLIAFLDELATVTADPATAAGARSRYEADERLRAPDQVRNHLRQRLEAVIAVD